MSSKTQANFRWRYQPNNELDKALLKYIKRHPALSVTEVMLTALRSFWLPMAIAHSPNHEEADKQRIVRGCVDALLRQADNLCVAVGLELPPRAYHCSSSLALLKQPTPLKEIQSSVPITASQLSAAAGDGDFDDSGLAGW
ncbi:MAG: hypothetical protein KME49_26755 [Brasilonema octagenarum HA4186-MV1]|jgi:hypothetical protein|nr:hypothetical protein [Brasilonema octagenarum HA4186-MV1]